MNKLVQSLLRAISQQDPDLKRNYGAVRRLEQVSHPYFKQVTTNRMDRVLHLEGGICWPAPSAGTARWPRCCCFFHGGGFVTGDFDSYSNVCATLAAQTGCKVVSVNYRLAPEHPFSRRGGGLLRGHPADSDPLPGLVSGGAGPGDPDRRQRRGHPGLCHLLLSRDRGASCRQDKSDLSRHLVRLRPGYPFASVAENGTDYILTRKKLPGLYGPLRSHPGG